jgi:hypothetical protein
MNTFYFHDKNKKTICIALNGGHENKKNKKYAGYCNDRRETTHSVQAMQ